MIGWRYRAWSRFLHRFNYHHTTTCYPDGDIQDWCEWCGLRMTRVRSNVLGLRGDDAAEVENDPPLSSGQDGP
jgi:hypothetical protein